MLPQFRDVLYLQAATKWAVSRMFVVFTVAKRVTLVLAHILFVINMGTSRLNRVLKGPILVSILGRTLLRARYPFVSRLLLVKLRRLFVP